MGEGESTSVTVSNRTPASAKITIALQTIIILFLGYWAFEEYQNNIYFQSYVNATLQVYMLPIAAIVFGVPALAVFGFFVKRSRAHSSETLRFENGGSDSMSSFGVSRGSSRGKSEKVSPLYAELSSRFGQSITTSNPSASQPDQDKRTVLQQADQSSASRVKTGPSGLPVLERVESRQQTLQTRGETQNQGYQPPRAIGDSPLSPQAGYRPATPPSYARQPDNPGPRMTPPFAAPMTNPSTVVTGVMGQGPRPYSPPSQMQPPVRPSPTLAPQQIQERWEPGVRPPAPLVSMPQRPPTFNPPNQTSTNPSFGTSGTSQPTAGLSRVGPAKSPGDKTSNNESSPVLNRIEPVQAVANRLPWPKSQPQTTSDFKGPSPPQDKGSDAPSSYSDPFSPGKPLQPGKRDDKREVSGENTGN